MSSELPVIPMAVPVALTGFLYVLLTIARAPAVIGMWGSYYLQARGSY